MDLTTSGRLLAREHVHVAAQEEFGLRVLAYCKKVSPCRLQQYHVRRRVGHGHVARELATNLLLPVNGRAVADFSNPNRLQGSSPGAGSVEPPTDISHTSHSRCGLRKYVEPAPLTP